MFWDSPWGGILITVSLLILGTNVIFTSLNDY